MRGSNVDEIKEKLNIVDIVGEYVKLEKAGANWKARCPFHNEKTPSFTVNEEKKMWHCFGCNKGGDMFSFVMEIEGLEFRETLKLLAEKAGIKLADINPQYSQSKNSVREIIELATKFYEKQLWDGAGRKKVLEYLKERGLKDETIKSFRLGYAPPGWENALNFLLGRGYTASDIAKTGLLVQKTNNANQAESHRLKANYYDRFRDRIMFPIANHMGEVIGYSARVAPGGDETQAKYINTPETIAYNKSKALYGIDKAKTAIKKKNEAVVVEGNMDVIAAHQAGFENTVAISGTALTFEQVDMLRRYTENIKLFFDMDEAGRTAAQKSAIMIFQGELNPYMVFTSQGKDAADIAKDNPEELRAIIEKARPAMDYFFHLVLDRHNLDQSAGKKQAAKEILPYIAAISDRIERSHWVRKLAHRLETPEEAINNLLGELRDKEKKGNNSPMRAEASKESFPRSRFENIRGKIASILLSDPAMWQAADEDSEKSGLLAEGIDPLAFLMKKGKGCDYQVIKLLQETDGTEMHKILYNIHNKAQEENAAQEVIDQEGQLEQYLNDLAKEKIKNQIRIIVRDIQKAEASGDRAAVGLLMEQFSDLSKKVHSTEA